jgi:hypothetical protein
MDDKHDPNGSVPVGTFRSAEEDGGEEIEIPIEIVLDEEGDLPPRPATLHGTGALSFSQQAETHPDGTPRRKRTSTLMGVPYPGRSSVVGPSDLPLDEISNAIDAMLEDQPTNVYAQLRDDRATPVFTREERPTSTYTREERPTTVFTRDTPGTPDTRGAREQRSEPANGESRDPALEAMLQSNSIARPDAMPPGEIIDVVAHRKDDTYQLDVIERRDSSKVPVLAPAQFVEARERDAHAAALAFARGDTMYEALPDDSEDGPARDRKLSPAPDAARAAAQAPRDTAPARPAPTPSSLAPLEVSRPRATKPTKPTKAAKQRREAASPAGYAMVAAMVLVGIGGWWLTAGGYERSQQMAAASIAPKAPSPASRAPVARPTTPETAVPAPTPPLAAVESPATAKPIGNVARKGTPAAPAPTEGIGDTPTRSQVLTGLNGVRSSVQACADGRSGVAEVDLTIAANGVVTNALVGGDFGGTPQGSCIARAVRKARFPEFKQDRFRLLYPYAL